MAPGFMWGGKPCAPDNSVNAKIAEDPEGGSDKVLTVTYQGGRYASRSGAQFYTKYPGMGDEGMLEYSVYFPKG